MSPRRSSPEASIQVRIMRQFAERGARGVVAFHIPNGGSRGSFERMHLAQQGVVSGMPDLCVIMEGRANFIELKTAEAPGVRKGSLSDRQLVMHRRLSEAGACVETAYGLDDALAILERWGALKPTVTRAAV